MKSGGRVYSVTQVNTYIRDMMRRDVLLRSLVVRGEVSNCTYHGSGHIYFTLKDKGATLSVIMFASDRAGLNFRLADGQQVQVTGRIDVYPQSGRYQLYASAIALDGAGALYEQFLRLKEKLEEEGLFDETYKRELPPYIRTLGVVTAPTGAAVRDIIRNALRRNPYLQIVLYPARVQGEGAGDSVADGIRALCRAGVDVIIAGRGGGSIEDLWAFNEEVVARAIFDATVPVISAVGHETDFTIADFVADLRAPTPSTAAELAVFEYDRFAETLDAMRESLTDAMQATIEAYREACASRRKNLQYVSPEAKVRDLRMRAIRHTDRLKYAMQARLGAVQSRLSLQTERLKGLSPQSRLDAGYAFVTDEKGARIRVVAQLKANDLLRVYLRDGQADTVVQSVTGRKDK